jgi:hypothetical protein
MGNSGISLLLHNTAKFIRYKPNNRNSKPDVSDDSGCMGRTSNIEDVRADAHDVVENACELGEHDTDVLGAQRHVNIQQLLHCQRVALPKKRSNYSTQE